MFTENKGLHHSVREKIQGHKTDMNKQFLKIVTAYILVLVHSNSAVLACDNDLNKAQNKFVDQFYKCEEDLRNNKRASAMKCLTVLSNDLSIFKGHPKQNLLLSDFYYVSGLTHTAMGYPQRALRDFKASVAIEPRFTVREKVGFFEERADWDKDMLIVEAQKVAINRINILRNPNINDRTLTQPAKQVDAMVVVKERKIGVPDRDARKVIFGETGLAKAISEAGYDELDQDMLFMKAAKLSLAELTEAYQSQFEVQNLRKLSKRAKHYYGLK